MRQTGCTTNSIQPSNHSGNTITDYLAPKTSHEFRVSANLIKAPILAIDALTVKKCLVSYTNFFVHTVKLVIGRKSNFIVKIISSVLLEDLQDS